MSLPLPVQTHFAATERIAYFTMEIAARADIPTYSGGLGILAGDMIRAAADLELPVVAVSLVSRNGYFRQTLNPEGWQSETPDPWDPAASLQRLGAKVVVPIEGREVWVGAWLYTVAGHLGGHAPVVFLDKPLGIFGATWLAVRLGLAKLPQAVGWRQLFGVALVAGIGFTMSLFIAGLAFVDPESFRNARLSVIAGSLLSAAAGVAVLWSAGARQHGRASNRGEPFP